MNARLARWFDGARPRTLGAGLTPVVVGTAAAGDVVPWRFAAAILVALGLQVGVNYANDLHDGLRGVDTPDRVGPTRLVASGAATQRAVLIASLACVGVAGFEGLALAAATTWWLVPIGAVAMLALWLYSGGPRPYAALGLGEVMVFVFFGLMATAGTAYVHVEGVPAAAWWCATSMGLLAVAILIANNLRDIPTDAAAGKRTLAVRIGDGPTRALYRVCLIGAFLVVVAGTLAGHLPAAALSALAAGALAIRPLIAVGDANGRELVPVLVATGLVQAAFGVALSIGLWVTR